MGLLDGKRLLITGVITDQSIAFAIARSSRRKRARPSCSPASAACRSSSGSRKQVARHRRRWSSSTSPTPSSSLTLAERVREHVDGLDGVVHAIGFAPASCLGGGFLDAPWDDVATALQVSTYSLKSLAVATLPLFGEAGGSILGMTFDATVAWPAYDWMGVAKAGWNRRRATSPVSSARARSGSTWSRPARCARWRPRASRASTSSRTRGPVAPRSAGTTPISEPVARSSVALLSDWFPRPPARSCTSTAASTRWVYERRVEPLTPIDYDTRSVRRPAAAVLRRPGGAGRRHAVPAQRDPRARHPRRTAGRRSPSTTTTSTASRRSTSRTAR